MTLLQILDASGLAVLVAQSGWIVMLHRRLGHLRTTLDSAGTVIGQLDAAAQRLDASSGGIARKVKDGLTEVDGKLAACRSIAQELTIASRNAEEVAARLDQALRQNVRLNNARTAAPPREAVEPLGFAARLGARGEAPAAAAVAGPSPAALAQQRQLAAELTRAPLPEAPVAAETFPVRAERSVRVKLG